MADQHAARCRFLMKRNSAEWGKALGLCYQLMDDVIDVLSDSATLGKPAGSDIAQGKRTLMVIHAMRQPDGPVKDRLLAVLGKGDAVTQAALTDGLAALSELGSVDYAREKAEAEAKKKEAEERAARAKAEKEAKEKAIREAKIAAEKAKKEAAEKEIRIQMEKKAAEKAKLAAEMAKITDSEAVVAHNQQVLNTVLPMRSKQLDAGVTAPKKDQLEQAVEDAENERYTAAQKGRIQSFVQKNASNATKVATKTTPVDAKNKKKPEDILEHQAKQATIERPVYAQKKGAVQLSAEAKKAAKAKRREQLRQKRI